MYFLHMIIIYLFGCLCAGFVFTFRSNRYIHLVVFLLSRLKRILCTLFPASLRSHSVRLVDWLVFERHCVYQVVYVFLIIISHYLLIRDVITPLYRYSDSENHLFITLACLFCSGLCYIAVCVTDPGVISVGNIQVFSQIYSYDNVVYTPKECALCSHVIPARSRHCARCDQCVFRFEHHCVWTNCCIGGLNYAYFLLWITSLLALTVNDTWLIIRMLREHIQETRLWQAYYMDPGGQIKPMDYTTLVQHLFMSFPFVVPMLLLLVLISLGLAAYLTLHLWLSCTNQTSTEFHFPSSRRGELARQRPSYCRRYYDRGSLWLNLCEVFGYQTTNLLREMRRRLPAQMEFKTH